MSSAEVRPRRPGPEKSRHPTQFQQGKEGKKEGEGRRKKGRKKKAKAAWSLQVGEAEQERPLWER